MPVVMFIGDATTTGKGEEYTLTQGWGGLVWATEESQKKNKSFVFVPYFEGTEAKPVNDNWEVSEEAELTIPALQEVIKKYNIDEKRVYTTGQSGGGMLSFYFNLKYPDLFAASFFVASQWDTNALSGLIGKNFFYVVSAGDPKASKGMNDFRNLIEEKNSGYDYTEFSATLDKKEQNEMIDVMLDKGNNMHMIMFEANTTYPEGYDTSKTSGAGEHMYSFDFAYKLEAVRDWLFSQKK